MERRLRRFIITYACSYCPHEDREWGKVGHDVPFTAHTVGEAVLMAESDPYIAKEKILGVRETNMPTNDERLKEILDTMDVPEFRKTDKAWLVRNLGIRNSKHQDFNEAMKILKEK